MLILLNTLKIYKFRIKKNKWIENIAREDINKIKKEGG
jgi:hypothetical protein